jgi:hypothetical protein
VTTGGADVANAKDGGQQEQGTADRPADEIGPEPLETVRDTALDHDDRHQDRGGQEKADGTEFQRHSPDDRAQHDIRRHPRGAAPLAGLRPGLDACSMVESRMTEPNASRPYMPGYGILDANHGTGLLPWSWAIERLERSHDYWFATSDAGGRPHVMPVWGVWMDEALWFSSSRASRKARNVALRPQCAITTDNAYEPVVIEGEAELIDDLSLIRAFTERSNQKYGTDYPLEFFTQPSNACFRVRPVWAFGLTESDFTGSPTRWTFPR